MNPYVAVGIPNNNLKKYIYTVNHFKVHALCSPEHILQIVSEHSGIEAGTLKGNARSREVVMVRQMLIYTLKCFTRMTLTGIGSFLNKHHSTIIYSISAFENLVQLDRDYKKKFAKLKEVIEEKIKL